MKNVVSKIMTLVAATVALSGFVNAQNVLILEDLPPAKELRAAAPFDLKIQVEDWWLLNTPAFNAGSSLSVDELITPFEGEVTLRVAANGGIMVREVDLRSEVSLIKVPGFGNISTKLRVTQVLEEEMAFSMTNASGNTREFKVSPRDGRMYKDGFFILPWLVKVEAEAFPGMNFDVFIQTFGFMGKDVFEGVNYFDFGKIIEVKGNNALAEALSPIVTGIVNINGNSEGPIIIDDDTDIEIPIDVGPIPFAQKIEVNLPSLDAGPWKNYLNNGFKEDFAESVELAISDGSPMFE